ncbi:hypothetical protein SAMN04487947_1245 [Halogeometricum rufum]|uniref:Uncharacterized protein n=1 Tax=Halogeometricum rufum TaxID=553469 RepID=A0A1I6GJG4_9EURY|nr:hypothetical protein [Halogeometricum rufum]SFR42271.1 hypothetical protein SAMN04487947_1245 [Halogeometricum rufum]
MAIEYRQNQRNGRTVVMTACPFCEKPFGENQRHDTHFQYDCEKAPREIDYSYLPGGKPA